MEECCGSGSCGEKQESAYDPMTKEMLHLAEKAWSMVMLDKLKAEFEKHRGETMSKVAEEVFQHSMAAWKAQMESGDMSKTLPAEEIQAFQKKLQELFSQ